MLHQCRVMTLVTFIFVCLVYIRWCCKFIVCNGLSKALMLLNSHVFFPFRQVTHKEVIALLYASTAEGINLMPWLIDDSFWSDIRMAAISANDTRIGKQGGFWLVYYTNPGADSSPFYYDSFPSSTWSCQCPCGCSTVVEIHTMNKYNVSYFWICSLRTRCKPVKPSSKYNQKNYGYFDSINNFFDNNNAYGQGWRYRYFS